jgi:diacylglycerol kinase (ATP)
VPLAVLPGGTGNLLAQNLRIPTDLERAVEVALGGARRRIDVGVHGGTRFLIMAGVGFDAVVVGGATRAFKRRFGWYAYLLSALATLHYPQDWFQLTLDDAAVLRRRVSCVLVVNLGRLKAGVQVVRPGRLRTPLTPPAPRRADARCVVGSAPGRYGPDAYRRPGRAR